ncbi:amino acid dehydrogenase [Marinomonas piezotolerans]|uniref:Amino acid dehydrogenase n=1 Tax=Marinomonas piezotolerans TaxID=2213058 RepID=A0A370UBX2_9GAMM|nr:FAD-binding oxidoreductase [Marinomonas piezotolerans]RDL45241.1 amino acid dehydrogenase [Marinomonas piezotolerans]
MAEFVILGAGMVGVSSALALQAQGHDVVIVDRVQSGVETSYGNAGIIQTEAVEPYALPRDVATLLRYALGSSNDVVWKFGATWRMASALWRYFRLSAPEPYRAISKIYSQLALRSTSDHQPLIEASASEHLIRREGLAMLYRDQGMFDEACTRAQRLQREYGLSSTIFSGADYLAQEPALLKPPKGVINWSQSWSCSDPGALTQAYASLFEERGGSIVLGDASSVQQTSNGWSVVTQDGDISGEHIVVALGPWAPEVLRRFGYFIPMVYKRGYHGHYGSNHSLNRPFLDVSNGVLAAPMTKGIRVTTGAALVNMEAPAEPVQLERGVKALSDLLPLGQKVQEPQWFGTRPCLPDMLPMVGKAPRHDRMWFHFGHGHQGFTQGPTTAEYLVRAIQGESDDILQALNPAGRF